MTAPIDLRYVDTLTGEGALDGSPVGVTDVTWEDIVGTGTRGASATAFTSAVDRVAFATADYGTADCDLRIETYTGLGGGDAIYLRAADGSNWIRIRQRHQRSTTTSYGPWYGTGWQTIGGDFSHAYPGPTGESNYVHGIPTRRQRTYEISGGFWAWITEAQDVTRDTYTSTTNRRYLVVEKSVAGVITTLDSWQVQSFGVLRLTAYGTRVTWYESDGATVHAWTDVSEGATVTRHGFGLGGSDSYTYASLLHNFRLQAPGSLVPPSIVSPPDGADVDISQPVVIVVASNYGPDNDLTQVDDRWRVEDSAWIETIGRLSSVDSWLFPTSGLTAPVTVELQVAGIDSYANQSGYGSPSYFTLRVAPTPPEFVSPEPGATVVASLIATVDFGEDATAMQARRVADDPANPGIPVEDQVYEDDLTLVATATPGVYDVAGDGAIHESGPEHVQVRRQTADGGSMWSTWVDLPVVMSLAHPYPPIVRVDKFPQSAIVEFEVEPQPADVTHPEGVELVILRDSVPVYRTGMGGSPVVWRDESAGSKHDYEVRLVAANGGVVIVR